MITADGVSVTTFVRADPTAAFRFFTDEIDAWWKRGPRYRHGGAMRFDADALMEDDNAIGRVLAWSPECGCSWNGREIHSGPAKPPRSKFASKPSATARA
jgi:hypothetical protein